MRLAQLGHLSFSWYCDSYYGGEQMIEIDLQIRGAGLPPPVTEHRFAHPRRWKFDFAWPDQMVAFEREGGTWQGGRHVSGKGYRNDCIKYSEAAIRGWKVIRATVDMIADGSALELLERALGCIGD